MFLSCNLVSCVTLLRTPSLRTAFNRRKSSNLQQAYCFTPTVLDHIAYYPFHPRLDVTNGVVRQAPFAIEEDGFGNFQLQIEVTFLDCVTTFAYDLILFDNNALHAYRTVRLRPDPEDWDNFVQLGGDFRSSSSASTNSTTNQHVEDVGFGAEPTSRSKPTEPVRSRDCSKDTHSHSSGCSDREHHAPYTSITMDRLLQSSVQKPLPQKHKKKLQLLHEAQLLLEDAQKQQSQWASSRLVESPNVHSPQYNLMPLSPDIPTWPLKRSPSNRPPSHGSVHNNEASPCTPSNQSPTMDTVSSGSHHNVIDDGSTSRHVDPASPVKRIVLKLSRRGSLLLGRESSEEHRERRRRKREQRRELQRAKLRGSEHQSLQRSSHVASQSPETIDHKLPGSSELYRDPLSKSWTLVEHDFREQTPKPKKHKSSKRERPLHDPRRHSSPTSGFNVLGVTCDAKFTSSDNHHKCFSETQPSFTSKVRSNKSGTKHNDDLVRSSVEQELFGSDEDPPITSSQTNLHSPKSPHPLFGDRASLLLEPVDGEFDDVLSRSLFSQCHDSTNADSPSVDLFGDEDRVHSDREEERDAAVSEPEAPPNRPLSPTDSNDSKPYDPSDPVKDTVVLSGEESDDDYSDDCVHFLRQHVDSESDLPRTLSSANDFRKILPTNRIPENRFETVPDTRKPQKLHNKKSKQSDITRRSQDFLPVTTSSSQPEVSMFQATTPLTVNPAKAGVMADKSSTRRTSSPDASDGSRPRTYTSSDDNDNHLPSTQRGRHQPSKQLDFSKPTPGVTGTLGLSTELRRSVDITPQNKPSPQSPKTCKPSSDRSATSVRKNIKSDYAKSSQAKLSKVRKDDDSKISSPNKPPTGSNKPTARQSRPVSRVDSSKRPPQKLKQHRQHNVGSSLDSKLSSAGSSPSEKRDRRLSTAVKNQLDVDLSSLSSLHSESSASSPTPPMSSCNSLFTGNPEDVESRRGFMTNQSSPKLLAKPKSDKPVNDELARKKVTTSNRPSVEETALPKQPPSHHNVSPASVKHSQESEETENVASNTQRKETVREPSKYSNQQLELLFDRLLRLRQPHLASRMGDILLQYLTPRSPKSGSKSQTKGDSTDKLGKSNRAVKILHSEEPRVIAFNLRKLPITCLDQLSGLIAEDESIPDEVETEPTGHSVTTVKL
ncbi:hypothetical protein AHF37_07107 [Paragonimus kellicotti]|nr:hypothetical protein AHF37_07107 [Paragonimus kellicotti]